MKNNKNYTVLFMGLLGVHWIINCIGAAFLVPLLQQNGFDELNIGLTMTLLAIFSCISQPIIGYLCDKFKCLKLIITILCAANIAIYFVLVNTSIKLIIIIMATLLGICVNSLPGIVDSWCYKLISENKNIDYGKARSAGSFTYAVTSLVFGLLLTKLGITIIPYSLIIVTIVFFIIMSLIPEPEHKATKAEVTIKEGFKYIKTRKHFIVFLTCYTLAMISAFSIITFYPVWITTLGGNSSHLGLGLFICAMSEVPVIFIFNKLTAKFGLDNLLSFSLFFYGVKSIAIAMAPNVTWAIIAMLTQSLGYAIAVPASAAFTSREIDVKYLSTAILLLGAVAFSVSQIFANILCGFFSKYLGVQAALFIMSSFSFIGGLIFLIYMKSSTNKNRD